MSQQYPPDSRLTLLYQLDAQHRADEASFDMDELELLLHNLWHCQDTFPALYSEMLCVPRHATYAQVVQHLTHYLQRRRLARQQHRS